MIGCFTVGIFRFTVVACFCIDDVKLLKTLSLSARFRFLREAGRVLLHVQNWFVIFGPKHELRF